MLKKHLFMLKIYFLCHSLDCNACSQVLSNQQQTLGWEMLPAVEENCIRDGITYLNIGSQPRRIYLRMLELLSLFSVKGCRDWERSLVGGNSLSYLQKRHEEGSGSMIWSVSLQSLVRVNIKIMRVSGKRRCTKKKKKWLGWVD